MYYLLCTASIQDCKTISVVEFQYFAKLSGKSFSVEPDLGYCARRLLEGGYEQIIAEEVLIVVLCSSIE